jgi:hypothetical protein
MLASDNYLEYKYYNRQTKLLYINFYKIFSIGKNWIKTVHHYSSGQAPLQKDGKKIHVVHKQFSDHC